MYHLYHLYQTDDLAKATRDCQNLLNLDPDGLPSLVIVQSAHLQRWLAGQLARQQGIWFQPEFATPDNGLRRLLAEMRTPDGTPPRAPLFMDDLKFLSFRTLSRLAAQPDFTTKWPLLARMLGSDGTRPAFSRRRLYELADTLAGLYFTWSMMLWSPEAGYPCDAHLFGLWENGHRLMRQGKDPLAGHEEWQAAFYREMFPPDRGWDTLGYLTHQAVCDGWRYQGAYRRIVLFGSAFLSVQSFGFFRHLAGLPQAVEVHQILLTPHSGLAVPVHPDNAAPVSALEAPFDAWSELLQPFLGAARESVGGTMDCRAEFLRPDPLALKTRWHSATTRLREVQSLKQNLLAEMAARRDSGQPLLPQQIAIMAPDIRLYRPWLEAWFPSLDAFGNPAADHLKLNLVDLDFGTGSALAGAVDEILSLADGHLERRLVLGLLENASIRRAIGLAATEVQIIAEWAARYNLRWGLNSRHRQDLETGSADSNTWDRAFTRLLEDTIHGRIGAGAPELGAVGRVADFLHRVTTTLDGWSRGQKRLGNWVREIQDFLSSLLLPEEPAEQAILDQVLTAAGNLLQAAAAFGEDDQLDWIAFRLLFRDQLAHLSAARGQHQIDGITCSSLRPYRAVPFRLIAVLGMNEGEIPRADQSVSFDLARIPGRSQGFISNQLQDNYAWLETLSSAREELWVWYLGRDAANDETIVPSPLVTETLEALARRCPHDPPTVVLEPTLAFDPAYFRSGAPAAGLLHTDPVQLETARLLAGSPVLPENLDAAEFFQPACDSADLAFLAGSDGNGLSVRIKDLYDFIRNPLAVHVRRRLQINLDEESADALQDRENLDPVAWLESRLTRQSLGLLGASGENGQGVRQLVQDGMATEIANDRLFPGTLAARSARNLAGTLQRLHGELGEHLDLAGLGAPLVAGLDVDCTVSLDPLIPDGGGFRQLTGLRVRLRGELPELLTDQTGRRAWLITSSARAGSASEIDEHKRAKLAVGLAILRHLGETLPTKLLHVSTHRTGGSVFGLDILDLGAFELDLTTLLSAWMANLVRPIPFYQEWLKGHRDGFKAPNAHLPLVEGPDPAASWTEWWEELAEPSLSGRQFGLAANPLACPYYLYLAAGNPLVPRWQPWYALLLEQVWQPLGRRMRSFIGQKTTKSGKAGKA